LINPKVFANTIPNAIIDALKQGAEARYLGPTYFQPKQTPLMFQQNQLAASPIDDPTMKVTPSPQDATSSSSDVQSIQYQSGDGKAKDPSITTLAQTIFQDLMFLVRNQKYPAMRDQDGRLTGWSLPRDHFENDISNFLEPQPEEVPEVKYPQSYQAASLQPVPTASLQQPTLGMPIQTAPSQQSTIMQVVLTPTNTLAHTRSSPKQPINHGATGKPVVPQVDSAQLLQTLLNQLAISSQLNTQQPTPSASQPIGQAPPITGHSKGSTEARMSTTPDP
jgi:hypothetical protein